MRLLVIEDDEQAAHALSEMLRISGHEAQWASSAYEAELALPASTHDVVLMAFDCASMNVLELLKEYRRNAGCVPIIVMTGEFMSGEPLAAIDAGADDYLIKPFHVEDLNARLQLQMLRTQSLPLRFASRSFTLDAESGSVNINNEKIRLTPAELKILSLLVSAPRRAFTRLELSEHVRGFKQDEISKSIDVHVHSLRRKLGPDEVITVRGVGYRLKW